MNSRFGKRTAVLVCLLAIATSGCALSLLQAPAMGTPSNHPTPPVVATPTESPRAETIFIATLREPLPPGETLALAWLDEVTGLTLNPQLYPMESSDPLTYRATLALPYQAIVKYRYVKLGTSQVAETSTANEGIRYRLYVASGPAEIHDLIAGWSDAAYAGPTGSIQGRVLNADSGAPIPNILVTAAGSRAFSDSGGRFELHGIMPGTHNLVAYAIDGTYGSFQQGATVAASLNTMVEIRVLPAPLVNVTFTVSAPNDVQGAPIRIAGNLLELGNTFADLEGGVSTVADRMPVMSFQPDGRYTATISLPAGAYVRYKYTLGDGYWNAEHSSDGTFRVRDLIVPAHDAEIQDQVAVWQTNSAAPILFEATVARDTPPEDLIDIQFNSYDWSEPIPMWPLGNNRWAYKLYGPFGDAASLRYRFCRDGQCGSADDLATAGATAQGRVINTSLTEQDIKDTVTDWAWLKTSEPNTIAGSDIASRGASFVAGVELQNDYRPNWEYYNPQTVQGVQALGANWLLFTPSWTFGDATGLDFGIQPPQDPFWLDTAIMVSQARAANLNVGLFPVPHFATSAVEFWKQAPRDAAWWQDWFDHYRAFIVNYADLAAQSGSQAIVVGGDWVDPALPDGLLTDGSPSGAPADAEAKWQSLIAEVRQHFSGKVWWAMPYVPGRIQSSFAFLSETDGVYLLWSAPLGSDAGTSKAVLVNTAGALLDNEVGPLAALINKPVMLGLAYPSASGVESGCLSDGQGGCLDWSALNQPHDPPGLNVDMQAQSDAYQAMLTAINSRSFITGLVSRGYYPPAMLQDKSASVHGKPAADLLWYWFPRLTGVVK
jgi:hypothetical protein